MFVQPDLCWTCSETTLLVYIAISDIVILGDFNLNMLAAQSHRKNSDLCQQYGLQKLINEPRNFTKKISNYY